MYTAKVLLFNVEVHRKLFELLYEHLFKVVIYIVTYDLAEFSISKLFKGMGFNVSGKSSL